jgi:hypothetical protein
MDEATAQLLGSKAYQDQLAALAQEGGQNYDDEASQDHGSDEEDDAQEGDGWGYDSEDDFEEDLKLPAKKVIKAKDRTVKMKHEPRNDSKLQVVDSKSQRKETTPRKRGKDKPASPIEDMTMLVLEVKSALNIMATTMQELVEARHRSRVKKTQVEESEESDSTSTVSDPPQESTI